MAVRPGRYSGRGERPSKRRSRPRALHAAGESANALGNAFGVAGQTIGRIVRGENWSDVHAEFHSKELVTLAFNVDGKPLVDHPDLDTAEEQRGIAEMCGSAVTPS